MVEPDEVPLQAGIGKKGARLSGSREGPTDPARLDLASLARLCSHETEQFKRRLEHDPRFCYELFRRAAQQNEQGAWEHIFACYLPFVMAWVRRHPAFAQTREQADYFANRAFERLWISLESKGVERFPDLPSLLRYLQLCVHSAIMDHHRKSKLNFLYIEDSPRLDVPDEATRGPEQLVQDRLEGSELWAYLETCFNGEPERVVIHASFVLGWKPRQIAERHPGMFKQAKDVYRVKQNVLARLARDPAMEKFLRDD